MINCLIAVEDERMGRVIIKNLKMKFKEWKFELCSSTEQMFSVLKDGKTDVLVLSVYLPLEEGVKNPVDFFKDLTVSAAGVQVVLLAGEPAEKQRVFVKAATDMGYENIVYGKLPGERPNNIFNALRRAEREVLWTEDESEETVWEVETKPETVVQHGVVPSFSEGYEKPAEPKPEPEPEQAELKETELEPFFGQLPNASNAGENRQPIANKESVREKVAEAVSSAGRAGSAEEIRDKLLEVLRMLDGEPGEQLMFKPSETRDFEKDGILVITAANKGGVGKTTVAVTTAAALSRAGVPVCLIDYDLESPNVAHWLGITKGEGIESLAGKVISPASISDCIHMKHGIAVLPGPMVPVMPSFSKGQLVKIIEVLKKMYAVVVCDTPPGFWTKPWLADIFPLADMVLAVVDQSIVSEKDAKKYAPYLLSMGVSPEKIGIVINKYSPKLHSVKKVEKDFCTGFKKGVKNLPRVKAIIPHDWDAHVLSGYKGEIVGLDDARSQWHKLATEIAVMAGYEYNLDFQRKEKKKNGHGFLGKFISVIKSSEGDKD